MELFGVHGDGQPLVFGAKQLHADFCGAWSGLSRVALWVD